MNVVSRLYQSCFFNWNLKKVYQIILNELTSVIIIIIFPYGKGKIFCEIVRYKLSL